MYSSIRWLWKYSTGFKLKLVVVIILSIGGVCFSLAFVDFTKKAVDNAVLGNSISVMFLFFIIGLRALQLACEQGEIYLRSLIRAELENHLEFAMFRALSNSEIQAKQKFHSGDEIYRLSSDVGIVAENMALTFPILVYSVIQLVATWTYLMTVQPILTIIVGLVSPLIILAGLYYTRCLIPISRQVRHEGSKVNKYIQEHLQHHELIAILGQTTYVQSQVEKLQKAFLDALKSKIRLTIGTDSLTEVGFALSYLVVLIWGINGIGDSTITYGEFLVFIQLVGQLQRPVFIFKEQYPSWVASFASVERLMEITSLPQEVITNENQFIEGVPGIRFSNVSFRYSKKEKWILKKFNHDFKPGTMTAILGETGTGKSTLMKMILAVISPQEGNIEIYGKNGSHFKVCSFTRCNCSFVPQGNSIISGTIRYNLLLGDLNASDDQMREALYLASAEFVFKDFPLGLDTVIGERGIGISEGQAQRIAIARGFLKNCKVLLLDEPTSALDSETEKQFLDRLTKNSKDKTIIIITHKKEICNYVSNTVFINTN